MLCLAFDQSPSAALINSPKTNLHLGLGEAVANKSRVVTGTKSFYSQTQLTHLMVCSVDQPILILKDITHII